MRDRVGQPESSLDRYKYMQDQSPNLTLLEHITPSRVPPSSSLLDQSRHYLRELPSAVMRCTTSFFALAAFSQISTALPSPAQTEPEELAAHAPALFRVEAAVPVN